MSIPDNDYQILKLTDVFYRSYPNPPYKEILKEYIFYIIVNFPDGTDILLYSIFTMSLDFLKIRKKQKTEKQKFTIKENVMSEQVKMPVRHFLRRDYLHNLFYIKFLLFVSLIHQIRIWKSLKSCIWKIHPGSLPEQFLRP